MAFKIIWSRQARDDLRDIVTFIAEHNHPVAESFGFRLMAKVDLLAQFPEIGRIVPEEQDENKPWRAFRQPDKEKRSATRRGVAVFVEMPRLFRLVMGRCRPICGKAVCLEVCRLQPNVACTLQSLLFGTRGATVLDCRESPTNVKLPKQKRALRCPFLRKMAQENAQTCRKVQREPVSTRQETRLKVHLLKSVAFVPQVEDAVII